MKAKIGTDMAKDQITCDSEKQDSNINLQQIRGSMSTKEEAKSLEIVNTTIEKDDNKLQDSNEHGNEENAANGKQMMKYGEDTGDNIKEKCNTPDESTSVPNNVKNMPAINLVVDLNDNMLDTYSSQEVIGNTDDENLEVTNENLTECEESIERIEKESDAQQHMRQTCDRNDISPVKRGRSMHKRRNISRRMKSTPPLRRGRNKNSNLLTYPND